ncbi:MAG: DegT/DnrJ/EryC1/StrS family aminotransferase [Nitrosomonas sp.]|nr:DegT/DnrJ/EryC1/StrS family aminotransferase [Nitrosomonas sp.]
MPTAVHYPIPLNLQPVFSCLNKPEGSFPIAEERAKRVMSLPMGPTLTRTEQESIVAALLTSSHSSSTECA